ncbi:hypothetical protein Cni_G12948 [Canna indica]|uniref:Uncharacterized protein n=1 Tax=Canna indica TaxID=4628 RepID=A0AAQ3K9E6_9LILI|nr:hypothetical protein Cni_G12948 [Canna indica]
MTSVSSLPLIPSLVRATLCRNPRPFDFLLHPRVNGGANPRRAFFRVAAEGSNGLKQDGDNKKDNNNGGLGPKKDRQRPGTFNFRWRDLLSPDPDNLVAVALTGLLTWASVQVLFQLFFISIAILLAALKYSFIAALLLFILITLL